MLSLAGSTDPDLIASARLPSSATMRTCSGDGSSATFSRRASGMPGSAMSAAVLTSQTEANIVMSSGKLVNDENLVFTWKPEPSGLSSSEVVFRANIDAHASKPFSPASASVCGCR